MLDTLSFALPLTIPLLICSFLYYRFSKNKIINVRVAVSSHCFVFVIGNIFSSLTSYGFKEGYWEEMNYFPSTIEIILSNLLIAIFLSGLINFGYSLWKFEGDKRIHFLIVVILPMAGHLYAISDLTLSPDWVWSGKKGTIWFFQNLTFF